MRALPKSTLTIGWVLAVFGISVAARAQGTYYPPAGSWERRTPAQVGLLQASVDSAVKLAIAAESTTPRDLLENHLSSFGQEPHGEAVGPFRARGGATGLIIRRGYIVAEWGDPDASRTRSARRRASCPPRSAWRTTGR